MERETGLEPATTCLEGRGSTTELLPQNQSYSTSKCLVLSKDIKSYMHSFTQYRFTEKAPRFGYILHEKYGDRVFQVCLHQPHFGPEVLTGNPPTSHPVIVDFIEKVISKNANNPVGFDVDNSPFANLKDSKSLYFASQENAVFSDIAQGYIYIKPIRNLGKMTWIECFVDRSNFKRAKAIAEKRGWIAMFEKSGLIKAGECNSPKGLNRLFKLIIE